MKKLVWDTSALLNIKEPNADGYSPANSLYKDFSQGIIPGAYRFIYPALALFELSAAVSRKLLEGDDILREFYLQDENTVIYPIDAGFIAKARSLIALEGFNKLRGADLIFACVTALENATLITLDTEFKKKVGSVIDVLDLNESRQEPIYRRRFD